LGASNKTVYLGSPEVGFMKSVNAGKSWKLVNSKFGQGFMGSMLVDPKDSLRVIAPDMANGLVITLDGGKTWSKYGGPAGAMSVDWNPLNRRELVALGMGYGAITKNDGKTWVTFSVPAGTSAIAISPNGFKLFIAVWNENKAKVFSSGDEGKTWS
jgi:hypothetical protein